VTVFGLPRYSQVEQIASMVTGAKSVTAMPVPYTPVPERLSDVAEAPYSSPEPSRVDGRHMVMATVATDACQTLHDGEGKSGHSRHGN
jgi:hypothetical protein